MSAASIQSSSASRLMNGVAKNNQQYFAYLLLCTSTQSTNCDIEIFQSKFDGAFVRAALTLLWRAAFSNKGKFSEFRARRWLDTWRNVSVIIAAVELLRFQLFFCFFFPFMDCKYIEIGLHQCTVHIDRSALLRFDTAGNPRFWLDGPGMLARCLLMNLSSFKTEALKPFHFWHVCCV